MNKQQFIEEKIKTLREKASLHPLKNGIGLDPEQIDEIELLFRQSLSEMADETLKAVEVEKFEVPDILPPLNSTGGVTMWRHILEKVGYNQAVDDYNQKKKEFLSTPLTPILR